MLSVANEHFVLSVIILSDIILSVIILSVIILSVIMLSAVMLNVIMLNAMLPHYGSITFYSTGPGVGMIIHLSSF